MKIKFKKQDAWIGVYWDEDYVYICIVPFFPIIYRRKSPDKLCCSCVCLISEGIVCTRCAKCPRHCKCKDSDF